MRGDSRVSPDVGIGLRATISVVAGRHGSAADDAWSPLEKILGATGSRESTTENGMPHRHFLELREAIHDRLRTLQPPFWEEQIEKYPWLYGALGDPSADVMFVCEIPSLSALRAITESPFGGPPNFDTQWTGNPDHRRDKRFRKVLCDLGLKDGKIWEPGGWHCYITNVIKQAALVDNWTQVPRHEKRRTARKWSGILQMEVDAVRPVIVFCVGGEAHSAVKWLQNNAGLRVPGPIHRIWSYSARRGNEEVERKMRNGIAPYLQG